MESTKNPVGLRAGARCLLSIDVHSPAVLARLFWLVWVVVPAVSTSLSYDAARLMKPAHKVQMRQLTRREGSAVRLITIAQDAQAGPLRWREHAQPLCHRLRRDLRQDRSWLVRPWRGADPLDGYERILRWYPAGELSRQVASGHRL